MASLIDFNNLVNSHKQKTEKTNSGNEKTNTIKNTKMSLAESHPELAEQWHPTKNGNLKPTDVTAGSGKKVWWYLPYDDPNTGKHFDFEWIATILHRTQRNQGCPYLTNRAVWVGFNDLATTHPEIAKQWHPTKNGDLKPTDVIAGSNKKIWWYLPYDDPNTGKHFDFEWQAAITDRKKGNDCPYLAKFGASIWVGFNDLATVNPTIAAEWHPTKNGNLKPTNVTANSGKNVYWLCLNGHVWNAQVVDRNYGIGNCPYCSNHQIQIGFNDLATTHPELLEEWDYDNNIINPNQVKSKDWIKVYWKCNQNHSYSMRIYDKIYHNCGCPYCSNQKVLIGFNDLATVNLTLAAEWHPTKNGNLKPTDVTAGSNKKVWWLLSYDDSKTGKHFNFEWQATVNYRNQGGGCPYLTNRAVWAGFNDLATTHPELLKNWNYSKNTIKPSEITAGSMQKVWWIDNNCNHTWLSVVKDKVKKATGCPYCSHQRVLSGFNDLATTYPEIAKQWHPTKNGNLNPRDVMPGTHLKVWWTCEKNHEWIATINSRTSMNAGCPDCSPVGTSYPEQFIYFYISKLFVDAKNRDEENKPSWLCKMELDIVIPELKIGIEYDGQAWHQDVNRDENKSKLCKQNGWKLIRVRESGCPILKCDDFIITVTAGDNDNLKNAIIEILKICNMDNIDFVELFNTPFIYKP